MSLRPTMVFIFAVLFMGPSPLLLRGQTVTPTNTLGNQDVVAMLQSGLSPEIVIAKIKATPCDFDTSPAKLKELASAGIPNSVVLAMVEAGPIKDASKTAGTPELSNANFAHVRVYRARRFVGSALAPSIYVDDRQVARIGAGRRVTIKLSPGVHSIKSDDKSSLISIEVKAGQEYFVRIDEETGFWKGHGKLTLLVPEQGGPEYALQKTVDDDRVMAKDMIEPDLR